MPYRPQLSDQALPVTHEISVVNEKGRSQSIEIPGERPLTIYLDKKEIVTLMTIGGAPEALVLGYLRNQRLVHHLEDVAMIQVDWDTESAAVYTQGEKVNVEKITDRRTVTSGCGQGTMFGNFMDQVESLKIQSKEKLLSQAIFDVNEKIRIHPSIYKRAGSVHACAIFKNVGDRAELLYFVEDVGRHNAVDAISGMMWLDGVLGDGLIFYTTGRLTSEMVIKGGQMGIPFLMTRSGATKMGLSLAKQIQMTILARCSGQHFLVYAGQDRIDFL